MAGYKRIMVSIPTALLDEVDDIKCSENKNRSELIREAMHFYLQEKKKKNIREEMRRGYLEMAQINVLLAEEAIYCDEEANKLVESKLLECC